MFGQAAALIRLQCGEGRVEPVLVGSRRTNQRIGCFFLLFNTIPILNVNLSALLYRTWYLRILCSSFRGIFGPYLGVSTSLYCSFSTLAPDMGMTMLLMLYTLTPWRLRTNPWKETELMLNKRQSHAYCPHTGHEQGFCRLSTWTHFRRCSWACCTAGCMLCV